MHWLAYCCRSVKHTHTTDAMSHLLTLKKSESLVFLQYTFAFKHLHGSEETKIRYLVKLYISDFEALWF